MSDQRLAPDTHAKAKQARGDATREKILDAAIACVAQEGYGAATTDVIAKRAGVTRGPIQYYFSDRAGLISAVFERLHRRLMRTYAEAAEPAGSLQALVHALLDVTYRTCRTDEHYALIEIIIASRSDAALRSRLEPLLAASNGVVDETWINRFASDALTPERLLAARYLLVAINRGLAMNSLTFRDPELFEREFELTRALAAQMFRLETAPDR